jgi:hypothetical protein
MSIRLVNAQVCRVVTIMLAASIGSSAQSGSPALPAARAHHSMVYDAAARHVLLAGGSTSTDGGQTYRTFDDLWSFDGTRWTSRGASGAERSGMALAFDSTRGRVLAFGGYCPCKREDGGRFNDLLELRNDRWTAIGSIPTRASTDSHMVYDAPRDRLVLFGGNGDRVLLHDTWEYDGASWRRFEGDGPGARADFAMTHDAARGRTVVFGGIGPTGQPFGDTWEFDGRTWTRVASEGPSPRFSVHMAYDSKRGRSILIGGGTETWAWDGRVWTKLADAGPPARFLSALAYDEARDRVVLFGGRPGLPNLDANDTWEWDGAAWARVA